MLNYVTIKRQRATSRHSISLHCNMATFELQAKFELLKELSFFFYIYIYIFLCIYIYFRHKLLLIDEQAILRDYESLFLAILNLDQENHC